jgi:hypothetical protein
MEINKMKKLMIVMMLVLGFAASGFGYTVPFELTVPGGIDYATVNITLDGTRTVATFNVIADPGYFLVGNNMFDFNVNGAGTVSNIVEDPNFSPLAPVYGSTNVASFGLFNTLIENQSANDHVTELTFDLTIATGSTWASDASVLTANDAGYIAAAHVWTPVAVNGSNTFFVGDGEHNQVPEPSMLMLFGSGLVGLALSGRKKFRK